MRIPIESYSREIIVRRSRFIAQGLPLEHPGKVKGIVEQVRRAHPGCDHVAWAFVHGAAGENVGMSDDREPHGTAGRPVLDLLQGGSITNILLTVTRYFGGAKLGTGGLVKAYGEAAKAVLSGIELRELVARRAFQLELSYESYDAVRRIAAALDVLIEEERFTDRILLAGSVPSTEARRFAERVRDATAGRCEPRYPV